MKKIFCKIAGIFSVVAAAATLSLFILQAVPATTVYAASECPSDDYKLVDGECVPRARNTCNKVPLTVENCPFLKEYVVPAINVLSVALGIVVVIMVAWGGVQYISSRDNPQQTAAAKDHVRNALLALVMYIFMIAFLNWLVPGGVFS